MLFAVTAEGIKSLRLPTAVPNANKHLTGRLNAYYPSGVFNGNTREP